MSDKALLKQRNGRGISRMKVTFVDYDGSDYISGVSSWLRRIGVGLQSSGVEVSLHLLNHSSEAGENARFFEANGFDVKSARRPSTTRAAVRQCLQWATADPPDVYVTNSVLASYHAAAWLKKHDVKTVGVMHSDEEFYWGLVEEFVLGPANRRVSGWVPVSISLEDRVRELAGDNILIQRIGYGTIVPAVVAKPPASGGVFRLVYVGRLSEPQKRISEVVKAICAAVRAVPRLEAWIVGDGPDGEHVRAMVSAANLDGKVRFLGRVEPGKVAAILLQCHALVLLSDYEGLPVSVLEAMAVGVVPICLKMNSGIGELILDENNGIIVPDRGNGFLNAVERLSGAPALWEQMSRSARARVESEFSNDMMVRQWLIFLNRLVMEPCFRKTIPMPRWIRLPPRNARIGEVDFRPSLHERLTGSARVWLGAKRRAASRFLNCLRKS